MADELNQDVQALKNWLRDAWRYLASNPSLTPFGRRELRNSMKQVESTLRTAISQLTARQKARMQSPPPLSNRALMPRFRGTSKSSTTPLPKKRLIETGLLLSCPIGVNRVCEEERGATAN